MIINMKDDFTFKLTPVQAQKLFSALECFREELRYDKSWQETGWNGKKERAGLNKAAARFSRQLNSQYAKTGIEVWGDKIRRTAR